MNKSKKQITIILTDDNTLNTKMTVEGFDDFLQIVGVLELAKNTVLQSMTSRDPEIKVSTKEKR